MTSARLTERRASSGSTICRWHADGKTRLGRARLERTGGRRSGATTMCGVITAPPVTKTATLRASRWLWRNWSSIIDFARRRLTRRGVSVVKAQNTHHHETGGFRQARGLSR